MAKKSPVMRVAYAGQTPGVVVYQVVTFTEVSSFSSDRRADFAESVETHDDVIRSKADAESRASAAGLRLEREGAAWESLPDS